MHTVRFNNRLIAWILLFLIQASFLSTTALGQIDPGETNPLQISISNISIDSSLTFRGLTGAFPNPVLSTISIIDYRSRVVIGLADTLQWLGPTDMANVGYPVAEIWSEVNEYHTADPSVPADPDAYNQSPAPLFTEVRKNIPIPTRTILIMDVSSSMVQELEDAKNGVRAYVELLRSIDEVGLIQFDRSIVRYQQLTTDKDRIIAGIDSAALGNGTAIYDPLALAIQEMKFKTDRCGIIIYTDGQDNSSTTTPEAVIDSARVYNVPIFTIALGDDTQEQELQLVASATGGLFFKAATAVEMAQVYTILSDIMLNYYMMAHTTTDPQRNDTWRTVEVSVKYIGKEGVGKGEYFVPGIVTPPGTDVAVNLTSVTDSTIDLNGVRYNAVLPGQPFRYDITVSNIGPRAAQLISVRHTLPDSVRVLSTSTPPFAAGADSLVWKIDNLAASSDSSFSVSVQLASGYSETPGELLSLVHMVSPNDTALANNADADTVIALRKQGPVNCDLAITQFARTDTTIEFEQAMVPAVVAGDSFQYFLSITNFGPAIARNITLRNSLADSITIIRFSTAPDRVSDDSLFWQLDSLAAQDSLRIEMTALVADSLAMAPFPLVQIADVICESDTFLQNNASTTTVYGINKPETALKFTNLAAFIQANTGRTAIINGDTVRAVFPGDEFEYTVAMKNLGQYPARQVQFSHLLPDSIQIRDISIEPSDISPNSLKWGFAEVAPNTEFSATVSVALVSHIPLALDRLVSVAQVTAENDSMPGDNVAADTVFIAYPDTVRPRKFDVQVTQWLAADTRPEVTGDSLPLVEEGDFYTYASTVQNLGPVTALDVLLREIIPDSATLVSISHSPDEQRNDTLLWQLDSLAVGEELVVSMYLQAASSLVITPHELVHTSLVAAEGDSAPENNFAQIEIYIIEETGTGEDNADATVSLTSVTPTTAVVDGNIVNAIRPGQQYLYELEVANESGVAARDVRLTQTLPELVAFIGANPAPEAIGDSLAWQFSQVAAGERIKIAVTTRLSATAPADVRWLFSMAEIAAANDTVVSNNADSDSIFVLPSAEQRFDLALQHTVAAHSLTVVQGDTVPAVFVNQPFQYRLIVRNTGPSAAFDISLVDTLSPWIAPSNFSPAPAVHSDSLLIWQFDSLAAGSSAEFTFHAVVTEAPQSPDPLPVYNACRVIAANDSVPANNFAATLVYALSPLQGHCDIGVNQTVISDSFSVANRDTVRFVQPGETFAITLTVRNQSAVTARNVTVTEFAADSVVVSNFSRTPLFVASDSVGWNVGDLAPGANAAIRLDATCSSNMSIGIHPLINRVVVRAGNEDPARLGDNSDADTVYNVVKPQIIVDYSPKIQANPTIVDVGDEITVRVQVRLPIQSWDLWVYLADGSIITDFADDFIASALLTPDEWYDVDPPFTDVRLFTDEEAERIKFELRSIDIFGDVRTAETYVLVRSNDNFNLDRNVYAAGASTPLAINFKLSSNRIAQLDLYDLTGAKVTKIAEGPYQAGWNTYHWDGLTEDGQIIGDGLYFITIESGNYRAMKKVMVVQ
ncbi:MAG: VWA domain-containing protein [Candidatus Zhuqueibacterota bacterium]